MTGVDYETFMIRNDEKKQFGFLVLGRISLWCLGNNGTS